MNIDDDAERATTFDAEKAPPGNRYDGTESFYEHYNRLSLANDDRYIGKWRDESQQTKKNSAAIVDAVAGQLELTEYQKSESHRIFSSLPDRFENGYHTHLVAITVCGVIGERDGRNYHPNQLRTGTDTNSLLKNLSDDLGVRYREYYSCWNAIKEELEQ